MINQKIALSALSIVTALALTAGATYAFFTDQAQSTGNTFSTGNANLQIYSDGQNFGDSITGFNASGIMPGYSESFNFWLKNNSTASIQLAITGDLANLGGSNWGTDSSLPDKMLISWTCGENTSGTFSVNEWINGGNANLGTLNPGADMLCTMNASVPTSAGNEIQNGNISFDAIYDGTQQ